MMNFVDLDKQQPSKTGSSRWHKVIKIWEEISDGTKSRIYTIKKKLVL